MLYVPEIEISIKFKGAQCTDLRTIDSSKISYELFKKMFNADQILWVEECIMILLNRACKVIGYYKVSKGGMHSTIVDIKVVALLAVQGLAHSVIIAHNHPSGNLKPSNSDHDVTRKLKEGLAILDIRLQDHMIIGEHGYYSYADEGII